MGTLFFCSIIYLKERGLQEVSGRSSYRLLNKDWLQT